MAGASTFNIGLKVIRKLLEEENTLDWVKYKLEDELFKGVELPIYFWIRDHVAKYHGLPKLATAVQKYPEIEEVDCPEPLKYYMDLLDTRFSYDQLAGLSAETQKVFSENKHSTHKVEEMVRDVMEKISRNRSRVSILDVGKQGSKILLDEYHGIYAKDAKVMFGWPYMDDSSGGAIGGDIISLVGRPGGGKSWMALQVAKVNWMAGRNVLFVSMEMNHKAILQRFGAMYAGTGVGQLKNSAYSSSTYNIFQKGIGGFQNEKSKMYVIDGNLSAYTDEIYSLASTLKCDLVIIDGAYLLRHRNPRLDRFTKVAENVENMKLLTTDLDIPTFATWQFNRQVSKKNVKGASSKGTLEDIGYSDAIGQVSSIVLGMAQEEGIEYATSRLISVLKGRNGEIGEFKVNWDFINMDFSEKVESEDDLQFKDL